MPIQPDEQTLYYSVNNALIGEYSFANQINGLKFLRSSINNSLSANTYLFGNRYHNNRSLLKSSPTRYQATNTLLKYDLYTVVAVVYNASRMPVQVLVKDGDSDTVSVSDVLPYDRSGVITLMPNRSFKVQYDRLDEAQLERVRQYLNVYTYRVTSVALKTRWSVKTASDTMIYRLVDRTHGSLTGLGGVVEKAADTGLLVRATLMEDNRADCLLRGTGVTSISSGAFLQSLYTEMQKITFSGFSPTPRNAGYRVRMTDDGNRLFCGAPNSLNDRGELNVYNLIGDNYQFLFNLTGQDSVPGDYFGFNFSITLDGTVLVVGSPHISNISQVAQAYVFNYTGSNYNQIQQLYDPNNITGTQFGYQIQVSDGGDMLCISAPGHNSNDGIVYIYRLIFGTYSLIGQISAPNGGRFGETIDLIGYRLAIAAPEETNGLDTGAVYLYDISGDAPFSFTQKITCPVGGVDGFGQVMAFGDDEIFIGYPGTEVFYFAYASGSYSYDNTKSFVNSTAISVEHANFADYLYISSAGDNNSGVIDIYNYPQDITYAFAQMLKASDSAPNQLFGRSTAASADAVRLAVGAPGDNGGEGAIYIYKRY